MFCLINLIARSFVHGYQWDAKIAAVHLLNILLLSHQNKQWQIHSVSKSNWHYPIEISLLYSLGSGRAFKSLNVILNFLSLLEREREEQPAVVDQRNNTNMTQHNLSIFFIKFVLRRQIYKVAIAYWWILAIRKHARQNVFFLKQNWN